MPPPRLIGLLPLHRVVLPGTTLVLPFFAPAARSLLADLDDDRLGTVLIRPEGEGAGSGSLFDVGTELRILGRRRLADDRVLVHAVGEGRIVITDLVRRDPYLVAEVEGLAEGPGEERVGPLRDRVVRSLRRYLAVSAESGLGGTVHVPVASDPVAASYQVASTVRLSSPERQELLELPVAARLTRELRVLEREIRLLERIMR